MNKVLIQCDELIDKYGFKENILKQLESMKIEKGAEDFAIVYCKERSKEKRTSKIHGSYVSRGNFT